MRTRSLGPDGPLVAAVGAGDVSFSRAAARGVDAGDVSHTLHDALECGLDVVDVADEEAAERLAGDAVRATRTRDRAIVACRVPAVRGELPARYVQQRVEAALRATRLDAVPLAQLGLTPMLLDSPVLAELHGTCERLVREGKVVRWGVRLDAIPDDDSNKRIQIHLSESRFINSPLIAAWQLPFNACERSAGALVAALLERGVAVLASRPLAGGALAGCLGPGAELAPRDDRRAIDPARLEAIAAGVAKLAAHVRVEPAAARSCDAGRAQLEHNPRIADRECRTVAELALRYAIDRGVIALPRLHRRAYVGEAVAAAAAAPLRKDLADLSVALDI